MNKKASWRDRFGWRRPKEIAAKVLLVLFSIFVCWLVFGNGNQNAPIRKTGEVIYYPDKMSKEQALEHWGHELGARKIEADKLKAAEEERSVSLRKGFADLGKDSAEQELRLQAQIASADAAFARGDFYRGPLVAAGTAGPPAHSEWANPALGRSLDLPSNAQEPEATK